MGGFRANRSRLDHDPAAPRFTGLVLNEGDGCAVDGLQHGMGQYGEAGNRRERGCCHTGREGWGCAECARHRAGDYDVPIGHSCLTSAFVGRIEVYL